MPLRAEFAMSPSESADLAAVFFWTYLAVMIPAGLLTAVIVVRTALEDKTLRDELAGYEEYAQRTRYRLVPGVW
jgi:protein-S-isoprenylcysteine O-methyltransferase Ste14